MGETTVGRLLDECAAVLGGEKTARDDAREIVAAVLDASRSWPSTHLSESVSRRLASEALRAAATRASGAPIQYAVGKAAFRHLTLSVDRRVLIPRPETEMLVDIVLDRVAGGSVADVGTGSGAIAIALATEGSYARVIATDISAGALEVARMNAARCGAGATTAIEFREGSLLDPLSGESLDAIVSNPPYIADSEMELLPAEVRQWEPDVALRSGSEGLDAIEGIIAGAPDILAPTGLIALETDSRRAGRTADILKEDGRYGKVEIITDLTGRSRFVTARRR